MDYFEATAGMTIDERLEFLLKSSISLYASIRESSVRGRQSSNGGTLSSVLALRAIAEEQTKQFTVQAAGIRQMAMIATARRDRIKTLARKTGI